MAKMSSGDVRHLRGSFEEARRALLADPRADRLQQPLAFWTLPGDRRLPLALLDRKLSDLLQMPFAQLSSTPGIGQKKITSLVQLLHRATSDSPPSVPLGVNGEFAHASADETPAALFDPAMVSEVLWAQWRATVRHHNIGHIKLGRLATSLQNLPTVIWHTPLSKYLDHSLQEIRQLRTHGEKRVRAVLEVFHSLHDAAHGATYTTHLTPQLSPKFLIPIESWIANVLSRDDIPSEAEFHECLIHPLLAQLRIDAGEQVHELARGRLALDGHRDSVRQQARHLGVTRARVYQLLDDVHKVFDVRWYDGESRLASLARKFNRPHTPPGRLVLFNTLSDLLYPWRYNLWSAATYSTAI